MVDYKDTTEPKDEENQEKQQESNKLASFVYDRFITSERARQSDEDRWLEAFHNYRGQYYKNVQFREHEKSRVFVKVTKTKVLAAYGQLVDVLFSANKFPISVEETKVPEGVSEYAHLNPVGENLQNSGPSIEGGADQSQPSMSPEQMSLVGFEGDGRELPKGATFTGLQEDKEFLGSLKDELGDEAVKEGSAPLPEMAQIRPATTLARRMEKLIHDEIDESSGSQELRNAIFESVLLGTGIIKGPFTFNKTLHRYVKNEDGTRSYQPEQVKVPRLEFVSAWDFYPDPNAKTIEECEYVVHRHKLNKNQLRDLLDRPFFDKEAVLETLEDGPNYRNRTFETQIKAEDDSNTTETDRFEVLEFWGCVDKKVLEDAQIPVPEGMDDEKEMQINAWVTENRVLRMVVNPFKPYRIPYNAFPYEKNPYSFFGIGVPENMKDAQQIMNGHARMAIDNLALSGSLVFDVDESALVAGQNMDVYPGKIFRRQAGMPGQAIHGLKFPNTSTENMMMFDKFRQLADESTGIPSYSHGQTGVQSMTRTASGMSMLLSAANLNIKTVVKNLDDFLLKPLGEAYFQWNMQFYEGDLAIEGDLEVKATGTSSLMQKEVRSQRLTMFLQSVQNPSIAPFVKIPELIKELAYTLDLDPETVINDPNEAEIYAKIIGLQNARQQNQAVGGTDSPESPMDTPQGIPNQSPEPDNSGVGNGTIGTGGVPQTGEMEFTGTVNPTGQN
ncbi:portal protein [Pelagibacter phage HTVC115P]|nr:portal protein [Pelagibacter phage HTVC115P]